MAPKQTNDKNKLKINSNLQKQPVMDQQTLDAAYPFSPYGRFKSLLNKALVYALAVHAFFILLFYSREVYVLAFVNVGSVLIYVGCISLAKQGKDRQAIFLAWLEILGHAAICTLVIGINTGFHFYIIVLLPFIFFNASRSTFSKISFAAILTLAYVLLIFVSDNRSPLSHLPEHSVKAMMYLNILLSLAMLAAQAHVYSQSVITGENELKQINANLQNALAEVKTLRGILPICSFCKKIRDDKGYWEQVDIYLGQHSYADVSHSICPECLEKHYPEYRSLKEETENI